MGVMAPQEVDARAEALFENYASVLDIEATTLCRMVRTGVEPACQQGLNMYMALDPKHKRFNSRAVVYDATGGACEKLESALKEVPEGDSASMVATYYRDVREAAPRRCARHVRHY